MPKYSRNKRIFFIIFIGFYLVAQTISTESNDTPKQADEQKIPPEVPTKPTEEVPTEPIEEVPTKPTEEVPTEPIEEVPTKPTEEVPTEPTEEVPTKPTEEVQPTKSRKESIIRYRIEKEKTAPEGDVHANLQEIIEQIDANMKKQNLEKSKEIADDIQEEEKEEEENSIPLTPEMEHANTLYHQGMKLINGTTNRQYETAYKLFKQAASVGHIGAKEEIALGHLFGIYLPMDLNRAKAYFQEGVESGSPQSHYGLYFMNSVGLIPDTSISKALVHLTFAASDGNHLAQMALAYRYWRSINVGHSCELALMFYQQVATHVASQITTASSQLVQRIRLYDEEEHPITNNILTDNNLLQYYQLLADRGDQQAQYGLGQLYYMRDNAFDKALYYFRLAAENGNTHALAYLGKLYSEKNDFIKQNNQTALHFFQRAAEKGNPIGQAGLGLAYYHGAGVEQSYEKALKLFQLSADQSYVEGQLMLGVMFYNGIGVKRDFKMAIKWFQAASQSGHVLAFYNLAQMHATGTGVLRSCTTATELFKNVAERGRWSNMFTEAFHLYKQGHIEQAFMIYLYLAELGYEVAQSNVAYIIDQMAYDVSNIYKTKNERYKKALTYWNRAALQGFHYARIKLGDYYYYGHGTEQNYELAASHYKSASDQSPNPQAMFNLAYMHENGLGLKRDIHLAKRFYDMAIETNADAYLPVVIALIKLYFQLFFENLFSFSNEKSTPTKQENNSSTTDSDSLWDLYLMAALFGLIGALFTIRRQRIALRRPPVQ